MDRGVRHFLPSIGSLATALLLAAAVLSAGGAAMAQVKIRHVQNRNGRHFINGNESDSAKRRRTDRERLPAGRSLHRTAHEQGRKYLDQGHYSDAIECLDKILESPDDYFFQPDKQAPVHRSLKAEAQRLLGEMPAAGRELYELHSGGRARRMLDEALVAGDGEKLAEVSGRYFHTRAGYEATFLLGLYDLDHGLPLAGALTLRRLRDAPDGGTRFEPALTLAMASGWLEAGMPEEAQRALVGLKEQRPVLELSVGGRQVAWFDKDADAVAWLARLTGPPRAIEAARADRWLMFRGDPARNVAATGSAPLMSMCWRVPALEDVEHPTAIEDTLRQWRQDYQERGEAVLSGLHPLVVNGLVLARDLRTLWAIDFQTGKRLWSVPADDPVEAVSKGQEGEAAWRQSFPWVMAMVAQRVWEDGTYGTLSSDGRYVFSVENLGLGGNFNGNSGGVFVVGPFGGPWGGFGRQRGAGNHGPSNCLAARDLHAGHGKLVWQIGGATGGAFPLPQAGSIFLGPPLPLRGQLYVLAEANDEIRLLALDAETGATVWSQQLAVVQHNVFPDALRRIGGLSPSYADGILICPTGAGAVVAVDLATRSLRWGYRYGRDKSANMTRQQQMMAMRFGGYSAGAPMPRAGWTARLLSWTAAC